MEYRLTGQSSYLTQYHTALIATVSGLVALTRFISLHDEATAFVVMSRAAVLYDTQYDPRSASVSVGTKLLAQYHVSSLRLRSIIEVKRDRAIRLSAGAVTILNLTQPFSIYALIVLFGLIVIGYMEHARQKEAKA